MTNLLRRRRRQRRRLFCATDRASYAVLTLQRGVNKPPCCKTMFRAPASQTTIAGQAPGSLAWPWHSRTCAQATRTVGACTARRVGHWPEASRQPDAGRDTSPALHMRQPAGTATLQVAAVVGWRQPNRGRRLSVGTTSRRPESLDSWGPLSAKFAPFGGRYRGDAAD